MRTRRSQSSSDPMSLKSPTHEDRAGGQGHRPVLLQESLQSLEIAKDDIVLDATLGGAGHAKEIVWQLGSEGVFLGIDADHDAIVRAREALKSASAKIILEEGNFRHLESYLGKHVIPKLTKAFFDLGWSSYQLSVGRGFSFLADEPLAMTYETSPDASSLTARRIVNEWEESSIADVIYGWGEETFSRQIARAIVDARKEKPIETAHELAEIVKAAVPGFYRNGKTHPATKTFQALRIAVNDEMGALKEGIASAWKHLAPGGRLAVISFHSTEDREVKQLMLAWDRSGEGKRVTKSPIRPSREEMIANPRARSAKLRVIEKV